MKKILLATDGSSSAAAATGQAIDLAHSLDAELHVVTVWSIPTSAFGYGLDVLPELGDDERLRAERVLEAAVEAAGAEGVDAVAVLREGEPATEICALADELHAELIVVGSHGWGALRRVLLGSVSARVIHHAPCPVLVVRGEEEPVEAEEAGERAGVAARG